MMKLRAYQQACLDRLYAWWMSHPGNHQAPIVTVPTGGGKSIIIAELCRLLFDTWPEQHPRTVVLVPSKELAEQNAEKLIARLPTHIRVGYYSASLGRKCPDADVIVATIGSIHKAAHLLGDIRCVIVDECHLINPDGKEAGRYRQFLTDLGKYCQFRVVGFTATPFRGNGIWLTDGEAPLFTGIAHTVTMGELHREGFLSKLIRPTDALGTRIDTDGIKTTSGDYNLGELAERVQRYLPAAAGEACKLAHERRKWIAFCATVENAQEFARLLNGHGHASVVVTGDTPKAERAERIAQFRAGELRCLVTVLALATGFDVPDVDCVIWLRPTKSPVLYVQGSGRGTRVAPGKTDCLWLDFSDTTERMGPVDTIKGRKRSKKKSDKEGVAPHRICENCGERMPIAALECPSCGEPVPEPEDTASQARAASNAAILSEQAAPKIAAYDVERVAYSRHVKIGSTDSLRVDYYSGLRCVASEWVCLEHPGFAGEKARTWWARRAPREYKPGSVQQALEWINGGYQLAQPSQVIVNETGRYPEIIRHVWEDTTHAPAPAAAAQTATA